MSFKTIMARFTRISIEAAVENREQRGHLDVIALFSNFSNKIKFIQVVGSQLNQKFAVDRKVILGAYIELLRLLCVYVLSIAQILGIFGVYVLSNL